MFCTDKYPYRYLPGQPMSEKSQGSRRSSLRFAIDGFFLSFKTEFEDGKALVDNISVGGCSIKESDVELSVGEKVLVIFESMGGDPIEISGRVIRAAADNSAIEFQVVDDGKKSQLLRFFAFKKREASKTD